MEDPESRDEFVIKDRRRFTQEGETREETEQKQNVRSEPAGETITEHSQDKGPERAHAGTQPPPPLDFSTFTLSLANTALFQLGFIKDPESGEGMKDLPGARQTIDLLALLEEKTRGNLTDQEAKIIKEALFQLRMAFVEASK